MHAVVSYSLLLFHNRFIHKTLNSSIRGLADSSSLQTNAIILKEKITELRKCVIKSGKLSSLQMLDAILHQIDKGDTVSSGDALFLISSCGLCCLRSIW